MPEVQSVGAIDNAQYQQQYPVEQYKEEYSTQPVVYDDSAEEIKAASKSRMGATILGTVVIAGLALWGGHAWGKKAASKEIDKLKDVADKYADAQKAIAEVEKLAEEGNKKYFGKNHCGNSLLEKIKSFFKPFKESAEEASAKAGEAVEAGTEASVKAAEDAVK